MIEQAALITNDSVITREHLVIEAPVFWDNDKETCNKDVPGLNPLNGIQLDSVMKSIEKKYISKALKLSKGNESRAAQLLDINYSTFRYRRRMLEIP